MRIKIVSDAHANFPSLKQATEVGNEDKRVYAGDIIGVMGFPSETVDYIRNNYDIVVKGNHDVAVVENNEGHVNDRDISEFEKNYVNKNLSEDQKNWIKSLSSYKEFSFGGKEFLVAHANPSKSSKSHINKTAGIKKLSPSEKSKYASQLGKPMESPDIDYISIDGVYPKEYTKIASRLGEAYDFVFLGHTHQQHYVDARKFGHDIIIINPGSVGKNYKHPKKSTYSILDTEDYTVEEKNADFYEDKIKRKLNQEKAPKDVL